MLHFKGWQFNHVFVGFLPMFDFGPSKEALMPRHYLKSDKDQTLSSTQPDPAPPRAMSNLILECLVEKRSPEDQHHFNDSNSLSHKCLEF